MRSAKLAMIALHTGAGCVALGWRHDAGTDTLSVERKPEKQLSEVDLSLLSSITAQMVTMTS